MPETIKKVAEASPFVLADQLSFKNWQPRLSRGVIAALMYIGALGVPTDERQWANFALLMVAPLLTGRDAPAVQPPIVARGK